VEWPEPEGDDDPDPLFDSRRDYVTQIDRYKEFQGKATDRKKTIVLLNCTVCDQQYEAFNKDRKFCSRKCQKAVYQDKPLARDKGKNRKRVLAPRGVMSYGPFDADVDPVERIAQLRTLGMAAHILFGPEHVLIRALRRADDGRAALRALQSGL
jgi:hypothetical protein